MLNPVAAIPPPPATLATALLQAHLPADEVVIAVAGDKVQIPQGAEPTTASDLPGIATAYGQTIYNFHKVQALGLPSMTLLNTHPTNPNIWDGMPPQDAMKQFLCTLDDSQWRSLTSESGLAYSDLASTTQKQLYTEIIGSSALRIMPLPEPTGPWRAEDIPSYLSDLPRSRLRLGQRIRTYVHPPWLQTGGFEDMTFPGKYQVLLDYSSGQGELYGVPVREQAAHVPKISNMDFNDASLRVEVPLSEIKTVKDLVQHIGAATHMEIYADPHYENRSVTLLGSAAPATDLLQGLAFCVSGTFRKVGTAYVLTNDLVGIGGVRELWLEFEEEGDAMLAQAMAQADSTILSLPDPAHLAVLNPDLAFTPQEQQKANAEPTNGIASVTVPFNNLSPLQQDEARRVWSASSPPPGTQERSILAKIEDSDVMLSSDSELQLLLPSLDAPAVIPLSIGLFNARLNAHLAYSPQSAPPPSPQPDSTKILGAPHRAVLAHPKTAAEVRQLVGAMQKAHLNELWLDVFSNGQSRLAGSAHPDPNQTDDGDIVQAVLKVTAHTGIAVYLSMDLLAWGQDTPAPDLDLTILGDGLPQAIKRLAQRNVTLATGMSYAPTQSTPITTGVSFLADDVSRKIKSLVQEAAREPGIAGLVWRRTALPGYADMRPGLDDPAVEFGYTKQPRLAFLRKWHSDPVDIDPLSPRTERADTSLPEFDDQSKEIDHLENDHWNAFRAQANTDFMRSLASLIQMGKPATTRPLTLLIQQRHAPMGGDWFAQWNAPSGPLPDAFNTSIYNDPAPKFTAANTQPPFPDWPLSLLDEQVEPSSDPSELVITLDQELEERPWKGYVIDLIPNYVGGEAGKNEEADFIAAFANDLAKQSH